jgi:Extended Signal Peptide of Type V secretion system
MNSNCYKIVFSKKLGALVAVGEHTSNQGKGQGARTGSSSASFFKFFLGALASGFLWVSLAWAQPLQVSKPISVSQPVSVSTPVSVAVNALPTGGQVVQGAANISQAGNTLSINQDTAKAVINWQSFDIGSGAKVNILQPTSQSVLLNC